jgi:hypothetical protein
MNIIEDKVSFHDANLVGVLQEKDCLTLALEDVSIGDSQISMTATVSNIESITRDDLQVKSIEMETDDGEVLRLSIDNDLIILVVTWHKHAPYSQDTHIYQMSGKRIRLDIDRT